MNYTGKLYGKMGPDGYFDTGKTSEDWDKLEADNKYVYQALKDRRQICDKLEAESKWISVNDRLPKDGKSVFTYCPEADKGYEVTNSIYKDGIFTIVNTERGCKDWKVTHWTHAPELQPINQ